MKKEKKGCGRPLRDFDQSVFEGLCEVWCTKEEIESIFKTNIVTVDKWCQRVYGKRYQEVYQEHASKGKASLRRNQLKLSQKNAAMAIWLGKQKLGQRDNPVDIQEFNGKLSELLDSLKNLKNGEKKHEC